MGVYPVWKSGLYAYRLSPSVFWDDYFSGTPLLFRTLLRGEFVISGFTNKKLRQHLPDKNSGQITRLLKRLRVHGLIKKVSKCYKYYLTKLGRQVAVMALKLREMVVIPALARGFAA